MLVIVRHRGYLDIAEWIASREIGMDGADTMNETLVETEEEDIPVLEKLAGVVEVVPAPPGWYWFGDSNVRIHQDGSWTQYELEGMQNG